MEKPGPEKYQGPAIFFRRDTAHKKAAPHKTAKRTRTERSADGSAVPDSIRERSTSMTRVKGFSRMKKPGIPAASSAGNRAELRKKNGQHNGIHDGLVDGRVGKQETEAVGKAGSKKRHQEQKEKH